MYSEEIQKKKKKKNYTNLLKAATANTSLFDIAEDKVASCNISTLMFSKA